MKTYVVDDVTKVDVAVVSTILLASLVAVIISLFSKLPVPDNPEYMVDLIVIPIGACIALFCFVWLGGTYTEWRTQRLGWNGRCECPICKRKDSEINLRIVSLRK